MTCIFYPKAISVPSTVSPSAFAQTSKKPADKRPLAGSAKPAYRYRKAPVPPILRSCMAAKTGGGGLEPCSGGMFVAARSRHDIEGTAARHDPAVGGRTVLPPSRRYMPASTGKAVARELAGSGTAGDSRLAILHQPDHVVFSGTGDGPRGLCRPTQTLPIPGNRLAAMRTAPHANDIGSPPNTLRVAHIRKAVLTW